MKVLFLNGADGWLGKSIIDLLTESKNKNLIFDYLVIQTLNPNFSLTPKEIKILVSKKIKIKYIHGCMTKDILSKKIQNLVMEFFNNYDIYVIHTASVIHPKWVSQFKKINYLGLKKIYESFNCDRLKKFTYISSNSPFGFNNNSEFNENSLYNPRS